MESDSSPTNTATSVTPKTLRDDVRARIRAVSKGAPTISVEQAGALLGFGKDAAYTAATNGTLPTIKASDRRWRVSVVVVERLLLGE